MSIFHSTNIALHVSAGTIALGLGFAILWKAKGTSVHRQLGRLFCYASLGVCGFAATGLLVFSFRPLFAALTILVLYQVVSGWRLIHTKAAGPTRLDAAWTLMVTGSGAALAAVVWQMSSALNVSVFATLGALALVLFYDACRWLFPSKWYVSLWRYEHCYKMVSSLFGMLSAFVGSVVLVSQAWAPLVVTVIGQVVILFLFYRLFSSTRRRQPPRLRT
jgi:uncharacterized membrane protein